jgi:hypothetical protein
MDVLDQLPRELLLVTIRIRHDLDLEELSDVWQRHALDEDTTPAASILRAVRADYLPVLPWMLPAGQLPLPGVAPLPLMAL